MSGSSLAKATLVDALDLADFICNLISINFWLCNNLSESDTIKAQCDNQYKLMQLALTFRTRLQKKHDAP